jgi:hypothetical protein
MKILLVLILLLAGCASPLSDYQSALDGYAKVSAVGDLTPYLVGSALQSGVQSQQLLKDMGWRQRGTAQFGELRLSGPGEALSCLDVSGVYFEDAANQIIELDRPANSLLMRIHFDQERNPRITMIQEVGVC